MMRSLTGLWFHTACRVWVGIVRSNKATVKGSLLKCHHPSSQLWMWRVLSQVCGFFGIGEELGGFRGFRVKRLLARSFYEGSQGARWGQGGSGDKAVPWVTRRLEKEEEMKTIIKESSCHICKWAEKDMTAYQATHSLNRVPAHWADLELCSTTITETPATIVRSWKGHCTTRLVGSQHLVLSSVCNDMFEARKIYLCLQGMSWTLARLSKQRVQAFSWEWISW